MRSVLVVLRGRPLRSGGPGRRFEPCAARSTSALEAPGRPNRQEDAIGGLSPRGWRPEGPSVVRPRGAEKGAEVVTQRQAA